MLTPRTNKQQAEARASGMVAPSDRPMAQFKLNALNEVHAQVMVVIFLASAFGTVIYFNMTLITVLDASKLFAAFGLIGFFSSFFLRTKLRLSLMDGFFYSAFAVAPMGLALTLILNAQCADTYTEIHTIKKREKEGSGFTLILENDAYDAYWHIRNMNSSELNQRYSRVQLTFCNGVFGLKALKDRKLVR